MARVDVFRKANKKGRMNFFFVPIYPHQVADSKDWPSPPNQSVVQAKDETEWTVIDNSFEFLFALAIHDYIEMTKPDGEIVAGYFKGIDRATGNIAVAAHENLQNLRRGIGPRNLLSFKKLTVDRLGNKFEIKHELRTWRGKVCT
jgi:CRISPR-associated endonuclease Csn1